MPNAEAIAIKKTIEKKRYPYVINIMKEFSKTIIITNYILDFGINLTVGELQVSVSVVKK